MLHSALVAFSDAVHMLLRNQVEKRGVLENLDLVLLCLDETIDDGCVSFPLQCILPQHTQSNAVHRLILRWVLPCPAHTLCTTR